MCCSLKNAAKTKPKNELKSDELLVYEHIDGLFIYNCLSYNNFFTNKRPTKFFIIGNKNKSVIKGKTERQTSEKSGIQ